MSARQKGHATVQGQTEAVCLFGSVSVSFSEHLGGFKHAKIPRQLPSQKKSSFSSLQKLLDKSIKWSPLISHHYTAGTPALIHSLEP